MNTRHMLTAVIVSVLVGLSTAARADSPSAAPTGLVQQVQQATQGFQDVGAAMAAGYGSAGTCVSGPEAGAMGVHFVNVGLIFDGALDAERPELLMYEPRGGSLRLLGAEYLVIAAAWDASNPFPPMLNGQHFHYVGSPNRYGLPAFYELHVWAWKPNPNGTFADFNPTVTCDEYATDDSAAAVAVGHVIH